MLDFFKRSYPPVHSTKSERFSRLCHSLAAILFCYQTKNGRTYSKRNGKCKHDGAHTEFRGVTKCNVKDAGSYSDSDSGSNASSAHQTTATDPRVASVRDREETIAWLDDFLLQTSGFEQSADDLHLFWDSYYAIQEEVNILNSTLHVGGRRTAYWAKVHDINCKVDRLIAHEEKMQDPYNPGPLLSPSLKICVIGTPPARARRNAHVPASTSSTQTCQRELVFE